MNITSICGPQVRSAPLAELNQIAENSRFSFAVTLIPIIGDIFQIVQEISLKEKILSESSFFPNYERIDALLQIKNTYKAMGCIRCLFECVIIIGFIAARVWPPANILSAIICGSVAAFYGYQISKNNEARALIQNHNATTLNIN